MLIITGLSLALVHSSTNMLKSVWASDFWKPLVHTNMSKLLKIFFPFHTFSTTFQPLLFTFESCVLIGNLLEASSLYYIFTTKLTWLTWSGSPSHMGEYQLEVFQGYGQKVTGGQDTSSGYFRRPESHRGCYQCAYPEWWIHLVLS